MVKDYQQDVIVGRFFTKQLRLMIYSSRKLPQVKPLEVCRARDIRLTNFKFNPILVRWREEIGHEWILNTDGETKNGFIGGGG